MWLGKNMTRNELMNYINSYINDFLEKQNLSDKVWLAEINIANVDSSIWIRTFKTGVEATIGYRIDYLHSFYEYIRSTVTCEDMLENILYHELGHFYDEKVEKETRLYNKRKVEIENYLFDIKPNKNIDKIFKSYKTTLLRNERRAWKIAETLLSENHDKYLFNLVKHYALKSYEENIENLERQIEARKKSVGQLAS